MKIRILDPGFANLTGLFGTTDFVDGVSVEEVSKAEAARLGTIISIECVETGVNPSLTQHMADLHDKNTDELGLKFANLRKATSTVPEVAENQPESLAQIEVGNQTLPKPVVVLGYDYTEDQLDNLVRTQGIAGLRAFTEQYDVNDRSVAGIVKKMMELKALHAPVAQVEPTAEVEVSEEEAAAAAEAEAIKAAELAEAEAAAKAAELAEIEAAAGVDQE